MSVGRSVARAHGAWLLPQALALLSMSVSAQSFGTAPEAEGSVATWLGGGGSYAASQRGSVDLHKDASTITEVASDPEIDFHFEAGVWGTGGNEPMVFAHAMVRLEPAGSASYLWPPPGPSTTWGGGYGRIPCDEATDIHCACDPLNPTNCNRRTFASGFIAKPYRFVNTSGMVLPSTVTSIPVRVDYAAHIHTSVGHPLPGNAKLFGLGGSVRLGYTTGGTLYYADCGPSGCDTPDATTIPLEGTFGANVEVAKAEEVSLMVDAAIFPILNPECQNTSTIQGNLCVVPPFDGSASVLVDPYVYIDPAWPYASWFEVQTTSDDADTIWVAVKRTSIDATAFGFDTEVEPMDGGVPDAGQDPDASVQMDGGMDGGPDAGVQGTEDGGGGCAVRLGRGGAPSDFAWLLLGLALARRRWVCRSGSRG